MFHLDYLLLTAATPPVSFSAGKVKLPLFVEGAREVFHPDLPGRYRYRTPVFRLVAKLAA